jgi:ACR3 family arsenite efflux pump ArsB
MKTKTNKDFERLVDTTACVSLPSFIAAFGYFYFHFLLFNHVLFSVLATIIIPLISGILTSAFFAYTNIKGDFNKFVFSVCYISWLNLVLLYIFSKCVKVYFKICDKVAASVAKI